MLDEDQIEYFRTAFSDALPCETGVAAGPDGTEPNGKAALVDSVPAGGNSDFVVCSSKVPS